MGFDRSNTVEKLRRRTKEGSYPPIISGQENDRILREVAYQLMRGKLDCCPASSCPFRTLGGLSDTTLLEVLDRMSRADLLTLFTLEQQIHDQH